MGTFTLTLKEVVEVQPDIGLSSYPIFNPEYREGLNQKIIDHYWNQEIGQETIEMFTFAMRRKMNEIMPKYNAIYKAQLGQIDPMINFRTRTTSANEQTGRAEGTENQTATNSVDEHATGTTGSKTVSKSRIASSDFPQTMLSENGDYATGANDSVSDGVADNTSVSDGSTTGTSTGKGQSVNTSAMSASLEQNSEGFTGVSFAAMIAEYNDLFINTDMQIIEELSELFMLIWDNGDAFTSGRNTIGGWFY